MQFDFVGGVDGVVRHVGNYIFTWCLGNLAYAFLAVMVMVKWESIRGDSAVMRADSIQEILEGADVFMQIMMLLALGLHVACLVYNGLSIWRSSALLNTIRLFLSRKVEEVAKSVDFVKILEQLKFFLWACMGCTILNWVVMAEPLVMMLLTPISFVFFVLVWRHRNRLRRFLEIRMTP